MNQQQIIELARAQGLPETETEGVFRVNADDLGRMLAAERERCAKVCEAEADKWRGEQDISDFRLCASAIRKGIE